MMSNQHQPEVVPEIFRHREAGASDRGLKRLKNGVSVRYFAKVPPTRTKISSDGGELGASDGGGL